MVTDKHMQWLLLSLFLSKQTFETENVDRGLDWLVNFMHIIYL